MEQITLRIQPNTLESIDSEADEHGKSRSEHIRDILESRSEHAEADELRDQIADLEQQLDEVTAERDRLAEEVEELEAKVDSLEARNTDLTNQLAEANSRIDNAAELVEYVDEERSAQRRWREAGLLGKAKYTVFGMPSDDSE